jgi:hypothetical protein
MVLRGATSLRGALEGVGPENRDFFGPKKVESSNDVAPLKTSKYKRHKINWYIGSFMYPSAVVLCCCVLLFVVVCCCLLLCVVVCKRGGEVSLQLCCVRRYSGGGEWLAGLPLPL